MNYYAVLKKHYDGKIWASLKITVRWTGATRHLKPTDEEMINHWNNMKHEYLEDSMRQQRNRLLRDSDQLCFTRFSATRQMDSVSTRVEGLSECMGA